MPITSPITSIVKSSITAAFVSMAIMAPAAADALMLHDLVKKGTVTVAYGEERVNQRRSVGVNVLASKGTPITSPADAVVVDAADLYHSEPRYGKVVVLKYADGVSALFAHLDNYSVKAGDTVKKGQAFASVGDTGQSKRAHLHIEMFKDSTRVDPASIWAFLQKN